MTRFSKAARSLRWYRRPLSVSLTGYVAIAAIGLAPAWRWLHGDVPVNGRSIGGALALVAMPVLFALANPRIARSQPRWRNNLYRVLQAPAALIASWGLGEPVLGGLLIIAAGQLAAAYRLRETLLIIAASNVGFGWILLSTWSRSDTLVAVLAYGSAEVFIALMVNTASRANSARDEILRINAELLATRQLLLEGARDEERLRISRELHDLVGHKLTALKLLLRLHVRDALSTGSAGPRLDDCERLADELLTDVRGVVSALRQSDGIDLHLALAALVPAVPEPRIELQLAAHALVPRLEQAHTLLRCAQEALTNALRHSGAARVVVRLDRLEGGVALWVDDDGQARAVPPFGHGLTGMRERLEELGGSLCVTTRRNQGLSVRAWLPALGTPVSST